MSDKEERLSKFQLFRGGIVDVLIILGSIASALSIITLINRIFDVGMLPILKNIIDFYRILLDPLYALIQNLIWFWDVPDWLIDAFVIYIVGVGISIRVYTARFSSHFLTSKYRKATYNLEHFGAATTHLVSDSLKQARIVDYLPCLIKPYYISGIFHIWRLYNSELNFAKAIEDDRPGISIWYRDEMKKDFYLSASKLIRTLFFIALIPLAVVVFYAFNLKG